VPLAVLAFLSFLVAMIPAALVQLQLEAEARAQRAAQISDQAQALVSVVGRMTTSVLEGARQTLRTMGAHDAVRALRPSPECDLFLARVVAATPRYSTANLFDRNGDAICTAQTAVAAVNVADRAYFRSLLAGGPELHAGTYAVGRATGHASLHLASPLTGPDGEVEGVVVVALSLDWLSAELARTRLPAGGAASIADRQGIVLARSHEAARFVGQPLPEAVRDLLGRDQPGVVEGVSLDGVRRIAAYIPVASDTEGLFIILGLEMEQALAAALDADRRSALIIVGSLLLTVFVCLVSFHAAVDRPVRQVLAVAQRWARREWAARIGRVGGAQEFKRLGATLDAMAGAVQTSETERRRAVTRMAAVVRVAPQIVMTADADGKVDWVNWYWEELTSLDLAGSRGDGWLKVVHEDDREQFEDAWVASVSGAKLRIEEDFSRELRLCRDVDTTWRWHTVRGAAIRDGSGDVSSWAIVGIDIHDLRQSQAAAQQAASRLRATYETTPVGLCVLDRDLRFLAVNDMLATAIGAAPGDHLGRTLEETAPAIAVPAGTAMRRVLDTGHPVIDLEVAAEGGDEPRVWLWSCAAVFDDDGAVTAVSGSAVDITARKRIERSERLLSREVDHRAQSALAVVRGLIRLSAADAPDDVPALVDLLDGRIGAVSRAHTLLAREPWVPRAGAVGRRRHGRADRAGGGAACRPDGNRRAAGAPRRRRGAAAHPRAARDADERGEVRRAVEPGRAAPHRVDARSGGRARGVGRARRPPGRAPASAPC
jgi:PAS domain S-box-containing protein